MQTWEYARLGWHIEEDRQGRPVGKIHFWRIGDRRGEDLSPLAYDRRLVEAGQDGWELVTVTQQPLVGETMIFKRAVERG